MKKVLKVIIVAIMILGIVGLTGCNKNNKNDKLTIISTSFPGYDFARAITKDNANVEVKMLLKPGAEMHDFEPTPQDIKDIKNSDIFIYVGGDSDEWIEDVLDDIDTDKTKIIKLMDLVNVVEEEQLQADYQKAMTKIDELYVNEGILDLQTKNATTQMLNQLFTYYKNGNKKIPMNLVEQVEMLNNNQQVYEEQGKTL